MCSITFTCAASIFGVLSKENEQNINPTEKKRNGFCFIYVAKLGNFLIEENVNETHKKNMELTTKNRYTSIENMNVRKK